MNPDASPALLTKTELEWLNGNIQLSNVYQRKIKSDIKKKIRILQELELPLLIEKGFILQNTSVTSNCNTVKANCNNDVTGKKPNSCSFLQKKEALAGIWTRDLCLTKATLYQAELPRHHGTHCTTPMTNQLTDASIEHDCRVSLRYLF
jgi:hypothetical protein